MAAGEVRQAYPCRAGRGRISAPLGREECYPGSRAGLSGGSQQFVKFLSRTGGNRAAESGSLSGSPAGRASAGRREVRSSTRTRVSAPHEALLSGFQQTLLGFFLALDAMASPGNGVETLGINLFTARNAFSEAA